MAKYAFRIPVFVSLEQGESIPVGESVGEVEAERYSHACIKSWPLIEQDCNRVKQDTGGRTLVGDLHVERKAQQ